MSFPNLGELRALVRKDIQEKVSGGVRLTWTFTVTEASPWIRVRVEAAEPFYADVDLPRHYAIWRATGAIYKVVEGAVQDTPVIAPAERREAP